MSKYEMLRYENLLRRIGITPGATWFCGANQSTQPIFDNPDTVYDESSAGYVGSTQHHATLCLSEDINVNGLLLNHRDENGTIWLCTGIDGWWTTPPSEIPDIPAPYWDGSLTTTGRYTSRTITITGVFIPLDPALVWYNRDAIIRATSIVRGVGLLATCGNQSPTIKPDDPFYDPPKMSIIQSADVPLIETTKTSGFTQFSLSFRCPTPTKLSVIEKNAPLTVPDGTTAARRKYLAFSGPGGSPPGEDLPTRYSDLPRITGSDRERTYGDVRKVNPSALIVGEEWTETTAPDYTAYEITGGSLATIPTTSVYNAGNYFAFPIFVFPEMDAAAGTDVDMLIENLTTGEAMRVQKAVAPGKQLIVDTGLRRVAVEDADAPGELSFGWTWDDRSALTLSSQWISLAPGANVIRVIKSDDTSLTAGQPTIYWRDTWIG